ncbi:hypothetical protein SGPA1_10985 [Streptomyces misionensis JCM 4497]
MPGDLPLRVRADLRQHRDRQRRGLSAARGAPPRQHQAHLGGAALSRQRDQGGRPRRREPAARRHRPGVRARPVPDARLLEPARGHRPHPGGGVAAHGRRRLPRRGRLSAPVRPHQRHDHRRRAEHLPGRGREGPRRAPRGRRRGRGRAARRTLGRERARRGGAAARRQGHPPRAPAVAARPHRRLQDPRHLPLRRLPAAQPLGQDPAPRGPRGAGGAGEGPAGECRMTTFLTPPWRVTRP